MLDLGRLGWIIPNAIEDIRSGVSNWRVWMALAAEDIGDQHRRTTLGPVWLLVNYLAFAGAFIFVIRRGEGVENYEAYVAIGLFAWFYVMETLTQSVTLFVREESFIKGTTLPLTVYTMRLFMQSVIRSGYAFVGCVVLVLLSGVSVSIIWIWSLLGVLMILVTTPAAIFAFAFLGAFIPDSQFVVSNLMRVGMFLTPVFWAKGSEGGVRAALYDWNPFTYFIELVRHPVLALEVPSHAWLVCLGLSTGLWVFALFLLGIYRKKVVFVL